MTFSAVTPQEATRLLIGKQIVGVDIDYTSHDQKEARLIQLHIEGGTIVRIENDGGPEWSNLAFEAAEQ